MPDGRIPTRLTDLWCAHEEIKCSLYIKQWIKGLRSGECIFWVQTVKTPHFHHKTKIKFIFLAELVIFILVKNVQLFYFFCKLHIFCHKVLHFIFRTIISVIFLIKKKSSVLLQSVNTVAIAITLGDYDGCTGPSQQETEAKINSSFFRCWTSRLRLARLLGWTGDGTADYGEYYWIWRQWLRTKT